MGAATERLRARKVAVLPSGVFLRATSLVLPAHSEQRTKRYHIVRLVRAAGAREVHDRTLIVQVKDEEALDKLGEIEERHRLLLLLFHEGGLEVPGNLLRDSG